jgi:hypothetical protein
MNHDQDEERIHTEGMPLPVRAMARKKVAVRRVGREYSSLRNLRRVKKGRQVSFFYLQ